MKTRVLFLVVAVLAILMLVLFRGAAKPAVTHQETPETVPSSQPEPSHVNAEAPPVLLRYAPVGPIIDEVLVERAEVCEGEDSLVTVRAHAQDGSHVRILIANQEGSSVPVRPLVGMPIVARIIAKDGTEKHVPIPLKARECEAEAQVLVTHEALANTWGQFEFRARVQDRRTFGTEPKWVSDVEEYRWDFGDRAMERTREPALAHSYEDRAQDTPFSSFLVTVEARLKDGRKVRGRHVLTLKNRAYEVLEERGIVLLMATESPRFPVAAADGSVTVQVKLSHVLKEVVEVLGVARYTTDKAGQKSAPETVTEVLGSKVIPAKGLQFAVTLPPGNEVMATYEVLGRARDSGRVAKGWFSVLRPAPLPTPDNSEPVNDPALIAKIQKAQQLLGKPYVTSDDLRHLAGQL